MSNSQMWATQMDAALLSALGSHVWQRRHSRHWLSTLSTDDERAIIMACARTIRWQLAIFYFASGFWKVNTSFLHPDYSCASIFTVQPLEYLPDSILFATDGVFAVAVPALARCIALIGPAATLVIEAVVPALHVLEPSRWPTCAQVGVLCTLVFHAVIGLTPPPSNVSTYGVTTCTRLFFVMPEALSTAVEELGQLGHSTGSLLLWLAMGVSAAASLALVAPLHAVAPSTVQGEGTDWHLGYYMALCVLFGQAVVLERSGQLESSQVESSQFKSGERLKQTAGGRQVKRRGRQVESGQVESGQVESGQLESGRVKSSQVESSQEARRLEAPASTPRRSPRLASAKAKAGVEDEVAEGKPVKGVAEGPAYPRLTLLALLYAFVLPILGLQEKAGCLMFSMLRLHGGSNHYMLPTSLLQRALIDAHPSSAFAGGVVRVEGTDLDWVGNTFAEHMGNRTLRLIREVARVPAQYVWAAKSTSVARNVPPPRFVRHTVSALGLRRLLATASRQQDTFWLRYSRLHGAVGDEAWRTSSEGTSFIVRAIEGAVKCARVLKSGEEVACDARELRLLEEPEALSSALVYFLVPQPNPIVPGYTEEMHCVTWG